MPTERIADNMIIKRSKIARKRWFIAKQRHNHAAEMPERSVCGSTLVTSETLSFERVWDQQKALLLNQVEQGRKMEDILLDSSMKFFAWFRILATTTRLPSVAKKYKKTAKLELTGRLREFIEERQLDIGRITKAKARVKR